MGAGNRGTYDAQIVHADPRAQVTALCDLFDDRIEMAASKLKLEKPAVYKDFQKLLASDIDAVIIATPDFAHTPMLLEATRRHLDAFVEREGSARVLQLHLQHVGDEFIVIKSDSTEQPMKFGYFNPHGWLGYVYEDVLFVKRYGVRSDEEYPDYGCNSEVYANFRAVELESLGPLVELREREECRVVKGHHGRAPKPPGDRVVRPPEDIRVQ